MASVGLAPNYAALVALLALGGVGVAMFHPQTATLAGLASPQRGLAMSWWVTGGTLGWALGPAYATAIVNRFGLDHTWVAAIPGLVLCAALFIWFGRVAPHAKAHRERAPLRELRPVARSLAMIYFSVVCRSAVSAGFATFLPLWVHAHGGSVTRGGWITTLYLTLGSLGGLLGGWLADHYGGRRVVVASFAASAPCYALFFLLPAPFNLPALFVGYLLLQASLPVNVVLGQELSPRHSSIISSLLMGAAWGLGSIVLYPIGALADHAGLEVALATLSSLVLVGFVCATQIGRQRETLPMSVEARETVG
jgi:FSR family fosmidomycin resistance protein-like MFS transporter